MNCQLIYFYDIGKDDDSFDIIKSSLSILVECDIISKINIILCSKSIDLLQQLSYLVNLLIRGGNIGFRINNKLYELKLIVGNKIDGYNEANKIIKENNGKMTYFYYTPNMWEGKYNRIDLHLHLIKKYLIKLKELVSIGEIGIYSFFVNNKWIFPYILLLNNVDDIDNRDRIHIINDMDNYFLFT